jgi:hypothetical protein
MTDPITPDKLRDLAREITERDGQMAGTRPAFPRVAAAYIRAAADEIERLERLLDEGRPIPVLTKHQREFAEKLLAHPQMVVRIIDDDAPKFVPISPPKEV